jgi:hypothetical protein
VFDVCVMQIKSHAPSYNLQPLGRERCMPLLGGWLFNSPILEALRVIFEDARRIHGCRGNMGDSMQVPHGT